MTIVWILSYVAVFIIGGFTSLLVTYYTIERWEKKDDKKRAEATNKNLDQYETQQPGPILS